MKTIKLFIIYSFCLSFINSYAQNAITVRLGSNGKEASVSSGLPGTNNYSEPDLYCATWTCRGDLCIDRGLFQFDLSTIPAGATLINAYLSLYCDSNSVLGNSGEPTYGTSNAGWLKRIASSWQNNAVTWNNQPAVSAVDAVTLLQSTSTLQNYLNIDVTSLVNDMISNGNYGFMLQEQNESNYYNSLIFKSGRNADSSRHPVLTINYVPFNGCLASFTATYHNDSVYFHNNSMGHLAATTWNFGDGTTVSDSLFIGSVAHHYPTAGNYSACLIVNDSSGTCTDTVCHSVYSCNVKAVFTSSLRGDTVTCTSSSINSNKLRWYFGDGSSDFSNNLIVKHVYSLTGQYTISLTALVDSSSTCSDSSSATISVVTSQNSITLTLGANGKQAQVTSSNTSWNGFGLSDLYSATWTSGGLSVDRSLFQFDLSIIPQGATVTGAYLSLEADGNSALGFAGTPTYGTNNAGWIKRIAGAWQDNTVTWANQPAVTNIDEVTLAQSTSTLENYLNIDVTALIQDMLNNGNYGFMLMQQDEVDYYNSLIFISGNNADSAKHPTLEINFLPPNGCHASFTASTELDSVYFHNNSIGHLVSPIWNFGDGTIPDSLNISSTLSHHYSSPGSYNVCLIVNDSGGTCSDTICHPVYSCDIQAGFTYTKNGNTVTFTSTSKNATNLYWSFGDGNVDNANHSTVTHSYSVTGQYTISLKVFGDSSICTDTTSTTIQIITSQTALSLQPGQNGKSAIINSNYPTTSSTNTSDFFSATWTCDGNLCLDRGLIQFDFSTLIPGSIITSATLSLYSDIYSSRGYSGRPTFGSKNAGWLRRITSTWNRDSVNWNIQPTTTTINQVALEQSNSVSQNYTNIDVTSLVQDMIANQNYGFMLVQQDESDYYNSLIFDSPYNSDSALRPLLIINFIPPSGCSAYFTANSFRDSVYFHSYNNSGSSTQSGVWNFGDGTSSANASFNTPFPHHYTTSGDYTACFAVKDSAGACTDTFCQLVHACDTRASFTYTVNGNEATFISTSSGASQVNWMFGDGGTDYGNHSITSHRYALPGQYTIRLQVSGDSASSQCFDSTSLTILISIPGPDTLSGIVFNDLNGNGARDSGEAGIANVPVSLSDNSAVYINIVTDSSGHFQFIVGAGTWNINITYQNPWTQTLPVGATHYTVSDTTGQTLNNFNFGLHNNLVTISGVIFYDTNDNGVQDPGEEGVPYQYVQVGYDWYFTDGNGNYSITLPPGIYSVAYTPFTYGYTLSVPDSGYYNVNAIASGQVYSRYNFGLWANPNLEDLAIYLSPYTNVARGFQTRYMIYFANYGANTANATITMNFDSSFIFVSADGSPSVDNINHVLTWYLDSLLPGENGYINCLFNVPQTLALGALALNWASIQPIAGDATPSNNIDSLYQLVEGSFDPNEKEVSPTGNVLPGQKLNYTVEFQNTGTAPAVNIVVIDTLSSNLDWTTFKTESASYPNTLQLSASGVVKWTFTNIELPDSSTSQSGSIGFVKYSINAKSTLTTGSKVTNFADVYFDFNTPVRTDTTRSVINSNTIATGISLPNQSIAISLYPNPMDDYTYIFVGGQINVDYEVNVMDLVGQKVKTLMGKTGQGLKIDKGNMISGLYLYELIMDGRRVGVGKIAVN